MVQSHYFKLVIRITGIIGFLFFLAFLVLEAEMPYENTSIKDFEDAVWYTAVTLTTVGYGDMVPVSPAGRWIGYILLILSLLFYGFLIGQISGIMTVIRENKKFGYYGTNWEQHAIIIGWNDFARAVVEQLIGVGKKVAVVTNNKDNIDLIREKYTEKNVFILFTDYDNDEMLHNCNIEKSAIVFINLETDTDKLVYILNLKKRYDKLNYVVTLDNSNLKNTFFSAGVTHTISKNEIAGKLLASYMFEPDVAAYSEDIMSYPESDDDYDVKQYKVMSDNPFKGVTYGEAFKGLKKEFNVILIGITKQTNTGKVLMKNAGDDVMIEEGDYLIIILNGQSFKLLKPVFRIEEGFIRI